MPHIPIKSEHPEWRVILFRAGHSMLGEAHPVNLSFSKYIKDIGSVTFDMNLSHPLCVRDKIEPYATDFVLMHKEHHILGGIITSVNVDVETEWVTLAGKEYTHYLEKRFWPIDPDNPEIYSAIQEDSFVVVTDILDRVLMEPHSLMMSYDLGMSGILVNYRIEPGDTESVYEKLRDLSEQSPGFDFGTHIDIIDQMVHVELMAESPRITRDNDFVFELGRNIRSFSYDCTGVKATFVAGSGAGSSNKMMRVAMHEEDMEMYRRLDHTVDFGDIIDPDMVQRQTDAELARMGHSHREDLTASYIPGPNIDLWVSVEVGDVCLVRVDTRYEQINQEFRVVGYEVSPSDQGDEEVLVIFEDAEV
jgi:hypothetical protein